jgi:NADPH-dependent glutamate synthase beta subunit-like oxidoreductase/NAD(P)H-flavin reductase
LKNTFLSSNFTFADLYTREGLIRLDKQFVAYLEESDKSLAIRLKKGRENPPNTPLEESALLLDLAPYVEDFFGVLFSVEKEIADLQAQTHVLAPLYRCKRLFVQRQAAKAYSREEALSFDGEKLRQELEGLMGESYSDLRFAEWVLGLLENSQKKLGCHGPTGLAMTPPQSSLRGLRKQGEATQEYFLEITTKYAAWSLHQNNPSTLFRLPRKINPEALIPLKSDGNVLKSPYQTKREGFDCTDPGVEPEEALDQAHYCILCHNQGKDSCSKGLSEENRGCPLDQKISEMNTLRTQGYVLGALAMIMVDNPLVAATGHRICNACMKGCIFQKQDPVNIPSIETQTLESVLGLPWGVEIYSLLSRWNPLNLRNSLPKESSGYKVLVAGMGPAGFTLSHYLLNEGHQVAGIDGLKIDPLDKDLLEEPVKDWKDIKKPLSQRKTMGFGGVAEYGITARWDKNYLTLIRLLLERRSHFALFDGVRLGGTLTLQQAFELGFDHVALCLGAGKPNLLELEKGLARGVRTASDFLMTLQLTGAAQEDSLSNLQIRLPILIVGGGLTAVDAATEALAYYPIQVKKFLQRTKELGDLPDSLSEEEQAIADEFTRHGEAFAQGDFSVFEKACTIVYRKKIQDSPSYRLNAEELDLALRQGVRFLENATPQDTKVDQHGHIEGVIVETPSGSQTLPCRTLLIATGTQPNRSLEKEDSALHIEGDDFLINYKDSERVSFFGDLNPAHAGNVVNAMASAKKGYPRINEVLSKSPPLPAPHLFHQLGVLLGSSIQKINRLTPNIIEIVIHSPQTAQNFQPGQFFRLQTYGIPNIEGIALTGASVDKEKGLLSLIVLDMGGSSALCKFLKEGERVNLMGPTGTPTEIPRGETVLLIGGGLGNAVLFSIGQALKNNGNQVLYVAGYKTPEDCFKSEEIEAVSDHVIWCFESGEKSSSKRTQDFVYEGNVIEGLIDYAQSSSPISLSEVTRILTIGSDRMMAAVACARKSVLKPYLNPNHKAIGSINSPMQCMMKEICGQCIQTHRDPLTGQMRVVFSCVNQDQPLDEVDFDVLQNRLKQNSLLEKQTYQWVKRAVI